MKQGRQKKAELARRKAVIFDFDGTIADSFEYVFGFLQTEARNSREYSKAEQKVMRQMSMKRLCLHLGIPVWKLPKTYFKGRRIMRAHMEHVQPFKGMPEAITALHTGGYQLFVASANSGKNIRRLLKSQNLTPYFKAVHGGSGYTGKAALLRRISVQHRLPKHLTWYVGDETSDVVAASAAGLRCLAVTWGFADPTHLRQMEPEAIAVKPADIVRIVEESWKQ